MDKIEDNSEVNQISKRLTDWIKSKKSPPYQINMYFTKQCNLKCKFCAFSPLIEKKYPSNELSKEELLRATKEGLELGIEVWYIAGGEPFFYPDKLLPMMGMIKKHGKYGNVNTNGTLFNREIVKDIVSMGWDEITFSINVTDSKTEDFLKGEKGAFKKCIEAMKLIQSTKKEMNKEKPGLSIHTIIMNKNYKRLTDMLILGHSLGVSSMNFTHIMEATDYVKKLKLTNEQIELFKKEAEKAFLLSKKMKIFTNLEKYISSPLSDEIGNYTNILKSTSITKDSKSLLSAICFEPWTQVTIFFDGTVGACGVWPCTSLKNENVRNKNLKDIWYGEYFERIRERLINRESIDTCLDCASSRIFKNEEIKNNIRKIMSEENKF